MKQKKITLLALIFETILSIFISGSASSEEQQEYSIKEKWVIWFKNTFNFDNFKNILKKIFKGFAYFLVIFSILNILIFTPIVINQLKSPRYPVAKAYLKSAFMVNRLYIFPLSKLFGYGNPLTWGLYPIKDGLYKVGMSKLPKDEGEREIWWFNIRFVEFKMIVQPTLSDSYTYNDKTYKRLPRWQVRSFEKWNDELYSHILSWPSAKISDPVMQKEKLMRFLDLSEAYIKSTNILSTKLQISEQKHTTNDFPDHLPYAKPEAVENHMTVVNIFNNLKLSSKKYNKESYEYFEKKKRYDEDKFKYEAALDLIGSKSDWGPAVTCDSPEVNILATSHRNLRSYYVKNYNNLKFGERGTIEILATGSDKIPVCENLPAVVEYQRFRQKKSDFFKNYKGNTLLDLFKD